MENTLENRLKFYSTYIGSDIIIDSGCFQSEGKNEIIKTKLVSIHLRGSIECDGWIPEINHTYLQLKPLSSITDEDLNKTNYGCKEMILEKGIWLDITNADILKSLGYALPWMGLSVEALVEYGWIKLKEN